MHKPDSAVVFDNVAAAPGVRLLTLSLSSPWPFQPGQVAELATTPGTEGYFAIASAPSEAITSGRLAFLVKAGDSDSEPLMRLTAGASITVRGPFGAGFDLSVASGDHPLLFVTAGTALAAIRSAVVEALGRFAGPRVSVLIGVRHATDLCFTNELVAWQGRGVDVRIALSYGDSDLDLALPLRAARGRVQVHLSALVSPTTHAFIAGSEELEEAVMAALVAGGVPVRHIQRNYRADWRREFGE